MEDNNTFLLKGIAASNGQATGKVRKMQGENDSAMQMGEVLVAPFTTPLMSIAIMKAAAIITEIGGVSSHAAIISRELGIPCVVGIKNATQILNNGKEVTVNGSNGTVYKRKKHSK